jgi:hypothetical protein
VGEDFAEDFGIFSVIPKDLLSGAFSQLRIKWNQLVIHFVN